MGGSTRSARRRWLTVRDASFDPFDGLGVGFCGAAALIVRVCGAPFRDLGHGDLVDRGVERAVAAAVGALHPVRLSDDPDPLQGNAIHDLLSKSESIRNGPAMSELVNAQRGRGFCRAQSTTAVASTSTRTSGSKRASTPISEVGGRGVGSPISSATLAIPAMNASALSNVHFVT
jgi:hypothetical protein